MRKSQYVLMISFLFLIFGLGLLSLLDPDNRLSFYENRPLAQLPTPSLEKYKSGEYFREYDQYFTDQFIGRQKWIYLYNKMIYYIPSIYKKSFYVQKDHTIIQQPAEKQPPANFSPNTHQVNGLAEFTSKLNIPFYFVFAPSKSRMLLPFLPSYLSKEGNKANDNTFLSQLNPKNVKAVNLSDWFENHISPNERKKLFFKSDHHWNMNGAFLGYQLLINRLRQDFPEISAPFQKEDISQVCAKADKMYGTYGFQLAFVVDSSNDIPCEYLPKNFDFHQLQVYQGGVSDVNRRDPFLIYGSKMNVKQEYIRYGEAYTDDFPEINVVNPKSTNQFHLLVLKDSYFNPIIYHVASHFKQLSVLDLRYFNPNNLQEYIKINHISMVVVFHNDSNLGGDNYKYGIK